MPTSLSFTLSAGRLANDSHMNRSLTVFAVRVFVPTRARIQFWTAWSHCGSVPFLDVCDNPLSWPSNTAATAVIQSAAANGAEVSSRCAPVLARCSSPEHETFGQVLTRGAHRAAYLGNE